MEWPVGAMGSDSVAWPPTSIVVKDGLNLFALWVLFFFPFSSPHSHNLKRLTASVPGLLFADVLVCVPSFAVRSIPHSLLAGNLNQQASANLQSLSHSLTN
ncbi:uncharacterized protein F5Z01DRAFT_203516 [Emericellopsis atlantica]|uniref:Uncharacterized protein n=1 Tax=Emericellopsis atlantica TaxID=2614577 RepID=A0A9P8CWH0_9HYPO|nr:uncharacterized protein F5Z01DRAFT_203516 [Emericellopsis atlantica]KAG9258586.1 hypothetical protein F5Z01DRAFT_203516 [Emericellopsis atlantica]